MLTDAICEQAGYNGDDEGEARTSKNQDIVFLDQETRLSLLVYVDGVGRNLNGKVDFAIWYEGARDGMGTNLVAIEGIPQCLCYMMVIHWRRRALHKQHREVWGMATDGYEFYFLRVDDKGQTWLSKELALDPGQRGHIGLNHPRVLSPMSTRVVTKASETGPLAAEPSGKKSVAPTKKSTSSVGAWFRKGRKRGAIMSKQSDEE